MQLNSIQLEMNLDVIRFLLRHGADREFKSQHGETAHDLAEHHQARDTVRQLLADEKQIYFHPVPLRADVPKSRRGAGESVILIEDSKVQTGCCTMARKCSTPGGCSPL